MTTQVLTPSQRIGRVACSRVFVGGHTFRLASGDTAIAVFRGVCVEERRFLIVVDRRFPGPVIEGPRPMVATIPKPLMLQWADHRGLISVARAWITATSPARAGNDWAFGRSASEDGWDRAG
ncbi:hypothetical protein L6E12_18890 [Actinokineospora sp. PR83]|uniref:hypothetical protein n=1 Tax=Actinokineospora sp. PR83 TaxID=2884908 RepID=UPI001F18EBE8|nr:hypothetical protein [Actinokineospora sp. PR83]MCG8917851.1 hypothetical protein [Actinokineospora sp. PR83]